MIDKVVCNCSADYYFSKGYSNVVHAASCFITLSRKYKEETPPAGVAEALMPECDCGSNGEPWCQGHATWCKLFAEEFN